MKSSYLWWVLTLFLYIHFLFEHPLWGQQKNLQVGSFCGCDDSCFGFQRSESAEKIQPKICQIDFKTKCQTVPPVLIMIYQWKPSWQNTRVYESRYDAQSDRGPYRSFVVSECVVCAERKNYEDSFIVHTDVFTTCYVNKWAIFDRF